MMSRFLCLSLLAALSSAQAQDAVEDRFHSIYKNYNEKPLSNEEWAKIVGEKSTQAYSVQSGDNLWSLSQTFFGDGFYWPKIWSFNSEITNPHFLQPGNQLRFSLGDLNNPPGLAGSGDSAKPAVIIPVDNSTPAVDLPPSLPRWRYTEREADLKDFQMAEIKRPVERTLLEYFLLDQESAQFGEITETEMGLKSASDFMYVYVRINGELAGKNYLVIREVEHVESDKNKAIMVQVQGEIEILENVNAEKNIYRAIVKKTLNPVQTGSKLVEGKMNFVDATISNESASVAARVLGGQQSNDRKMLAQNNLIFLSAGVQQGVQVGQRLPIYKRQLIRNTATLENQAHLKIADVKVVHTSQNFSTALVIHANSEILTGDITTSR